MGHGRPILIAITALATTALTLSGCATPTAAAHKTTVNLVGYSVVQPANDALEKAFARTPAGRNVTFQASYGPSGSQSKAVLAGQPADYVVFSVAPDLQNLVPAVVAPDWDANATKGMVTDSVVVIVVRKGNPLHITGWDDLAKPGVKIVTPDPASSGSAKWNILAAYEHVIADGGTPAQAGAYLRKFFGNVVSRAASGAVATTQFLNGTGNVLISYEDEAIAARQAGDAIDYLVPDQTMLIQNPAATTKSAPPAARAFLAFARGAAGQRILESKGFRPVVRGLSPETVKGANDPSDPFPTPAHLITIASLGGWDAVNSKFFDPATGIVTRIESGS